MSVSPRWAVVSGVAGLVANVLLILFFVVSGPWTSAGDLDWLGTANDVTVVVQFAALVPVALGIRAGLARAVTVTAVWPLVLARTSAEVER
jgi:hypothetical protein